MPAWPVPQASPECPSREALSPDLRGGCLWTYCPAPPSASSRKLASRSRAPPHLPLARKRMLRTCERTQQVFGTFLLSRERETREKRLSSPAQSAGGAGRATGPGCWALLWPGEAKQLGSDPRPGQQHCSEETVRVGSKAPLAASDQQPVQARGHVEDLKDPGPGALGVRPPRSWAERMGEGGRAVMSAGPSCQLLHGFPPTPGREPTAGAVHLPLRRPHKETVRTKEANSESDVEILTFS